ncbi:MAG: ABC transporter ATP-binding protein/permease [Clostridia bacterium]|nr:ABC transporter ATP-binding protein/permease [Clostridia bacterium]
MKKKSLIFETKKPNDKLPKFAESVICEKGLSTEGLIYSCRGDMDNNACYNDSFLFFDDKGLYVILGKEQIQKKRRLNSHTPDVKYILEEIKSFPLEEINSIEIESYTSTGSLVATDKDGQFPIIRFSLGLTENFNKFAKAFNSYKKSGITDFHDLNNDNENKCKKCGSPCPPGKDFCRKHDKTGNTAIRLIKFFGGYKLQITAVVLIMVISAAVQAFIPQISTRALYDNVLSNPNGSSVDETLKALAVLVLSIVGIRLLNTVITVIQEYISASIMPRVMYDIKVKIFNAMQRLSVNFYSSRQTGSLMDRVTRDANNIYWFFTDGIPRLIIDSATIIGVIIIMFSMSVKLSLIALISTPILFVTLILGDKLFRSMHHKVWVYHSKAGSMVSDNINGQRIIKAFAKEDDELKNFSEVSNKVKNAEIKLGVSEATLFPALEVIVILLSTLVLGYGGIMIAKGEGNMTTGKLLSFIVYLEMLREPFGFLSWVSNWWSRCADSAQRIFEICDSEPDITEKENAVSLSNLKGNIDISELEFEYEPAKPVIKEMNLHISAGNMLGIVGKTGAGKTTIANLITRLYDAKEGSIKIDGIDVRDLKMSELRKNIGLVSQDIYLFIGSIADNIRYAKPDASMEEVIAAAKAACAHDFIMKLPDAYETRVGAGGQKLSGGERQRVSIARTIIQNPGILILDEATAAMDTETERNIQRSLGILSKGRTTIAIAHRLSTLRDSDYLAVIDEGRITEYGTFTELIKAKGEFYKLYEIQAKALETIGIGRNEIDNSIRKDEEETENE